MGTVTLSAPGSVQTTSARSVHDRRILYVGFRADERSDQVELRRLRYFVVLGQELNFTRAAEILGIAQPALSQQIRVLEREVGAVLLTRSSRGVSLTAAGSVLYEAGQGLLAEAEGIVQRTRAVGSGMAGLLRVAYSSSLVDVGPDLVREFRRLYPDVRVTAETGFWTSYNVAQTRNRSVDVAFVWLPLLDGTGVRTMRIGYHELVAVMSAENRLAVADVLDVADLDGVPLCILPGMVDYASRIASSWRSIRANLAVEEPDPTLLYGAVVDNPALVGVMYRAHAEMLGTEGIVIRSFSEPHRAGYGVAWSPESRGAVVSGFLELCRKTAELQR